MKRILAKSFEKRRKAKIGESFILKNAREVGTGLGVTIPISYEVIRIDRNVVKVRREGRDFGVYVVSSSKEDLLKYSGSGLRPIHYKYVIF